MRQDARTTWLDGLTVLQVGHTPALTVAGPVLAQLGAAVDVVAELPTDVTADVVLVDRISGPVDVPGVGAAIAADYLKHVTAKNTRVWVTATAFGISSARGDAYATDMTLLAAGGILGHSRPDQDVAPTLPPGHMSLKLVGHLMAAAALHGVHLYRDSFEPVHLDVSGQASIIATGLTLEMAHALSRCPNEGGSSRYGAPSGFVECRDGSVYVLVMEDHQWQSFRSVLGKPLEEIRSLDEARTQTNYVNECMRGWAAERTAQECEEVLQGAGVPCTAVNSLDEFSRRSEKIGRNVSAERGDARPVLPAQVVDHRPMVNPQKQGSSPLSSFHVLDAGHVLAVPLAAAWLGALGARVTKLEDPARMDVYRRRGPFVDGVAGPNRSAYFNQVNFCKQSLPFSTSDGKGALELDDFDIVLENLSPHRAERVGVDSHSVAGVERDMLLLSSSGFGHTGEWSDYRAYGHNIHAFAGVVAASRDGHGNMGDIGTPWADPLTSAALVAWVLAWTLSPQRESFSFDISMAELVAAQISELEISDVDPFAAPAEGDDFFLVVPGADRLLAVGLQSEDQRQRFEAVTGIQIPKQERRGTMVQVMSAHSATGRGTVTLMDDLLAEGIAASWVYTAPELARDPFVRGTGLFHTMNSPALGDYEVTGMPWTPLDREPRPFRAAPEVPVSALV